MKRSLILLFLAAVLSLHANVTERYYFTSNGRVQFRSEAPLELITATSEKMVGLIDPIKKTFAFRIPMESFNGFNSSLQQTHFNEKFMESEKYPDAKFSGTLPFDFSELNKGVQTYQVAGELTIHGVKKERTIPVRLFVANQMIVFESTFKVRLEDHNIKVPKIVYQKIASEITVEAKGQMRLRFSN